MFRKRFLRAREIRSAAHLDQARIPAVRTATTATDPIAAAAKSIDLAHDNPLWLEVHQRIEQQVEESKWQVVDAENQLRPQLLSFYAGGINVLERLQAFLVAEREKALLEADDE